MPIRVDDQTAMQSGANLLLLYLTKVYKDHQPSGLTMADYLLHSILKKKCYD